MPGARRSSLAPLLLLLPLAACLPHRLSLQARLGQVESAIGATGAAPSKYLRYAVSSEAGEWRREIVIDGAAYAERRTRVEDGITYSFGRDAQGAWFRAGEGEVLSVDDGSWDQDARTHAAFFGLGFTRAGASDEAEYLGRSRRAWEFAYRPAGGRTLTFQVSHVDGKPRGFDVIDDLGRLVRCEHLSWMRSTLGPLLASLHCEANQGGLRGGVLSEQLELTQSVALTGADVLPWARPGASRRVPRRFDRSIEIPLRDPRRPLVPITVGDHEARSFVLDTGASRTTITSAAARALGVIPTGEVRRHTDPAWLPSTDLWIGVVPRMSVGGVEVFGERVLVAENPRFLARTEEVGLLGNDLLSRFVVDVDSPARVVRFTPHVAFRPDTDATRVFLRDHNQIEGAVDGVDSGALILDTGATQEIIVHSPWMKLAHPRQRNSDAALGGPDTGRSPDYYSKIDGLWFGPFALPAMDAIGRDWARERVGGGVALVGMGVMRYFRVAFDMRQGTLYLWPGDAYLALRRAGIELEEGGPAGEGKLAVSGLPTVDRVVPGSPADLAEMRRGDVFLGVAPDLLHRPDNDAARKALGRSASRDLMVWMSRHGRPRPVQLTLEPPVCLPVNSPLCDYTPPRVERRPRKQW